MQEKKEKKEFEIESDEQIEGFVDNYPEEENEQKIKLGSYISSQESEIHSSRQGYNTALEG